MENSYLFLEMSKFNNFTDLENVVSAEVPSAYHPTKLVTANVNLTTVIQMSPVNTTTQSTTTATTTSTTTSTTSSTTTSTAAKMTSTGQTSTLETLGVETIETEIPATTEQLTKRTIQTNPPHIVLTSG